MLLCFHVSPYVTSVLPCPMFFAPLVCPFLLLGSLFLARCFPSPLYLPFHISSFIFFSLFFPPNQVSPFLLLLRYLLPYSVFPPFPFSLSRLVPSPSPNPLLISLFLLFLTSFLNVLSYIVSPSFLHSSLGVPLPLISVSWSFPLHVSQYLRFNYPPHPSSFFTSSLTVHPPSLPPLSLSVPSPSSRPHVDTTTRPKAPRHLYKPQLDPSEPG